MEYQAADEHLKTWQAHEALKEYIRNGVSVAKARALYRHMRGPWEQAKVRSHCAISPVISVTYMEATNDV